MSQSFANWTPAQVSACQLVAEAAARLFEHWGYRGLVGRAWAVLFLAHEPQDAAALRKHLDISTGALSMTLRDLVELGLVYREAAAHERRFFYVAETDLWLVITRLFRERERKRLEAVIDRIKNAERLLTSDQNREDAKGRHMLEQVHRLAEMSDFVRDVLDAAMDRSKVEIKAARRVLSVSDRLGGGAFQRLRRALQNSRH